MSEHEPEISILDRRLAEIDQRLSRIQVGLTEEVSEAGPAAPAVALAPVAPISDDANGRSNDDDEGHVTAELRGLVGDHARLLDRLAELVAAGERLFTDRLAVSGGPAAAGPAAPGLSAPSISPLEVPPAATAAGALTVTAGPFATLEAVRAFERTLSTLPGVTSAEVRGYEGGDRAVVDVHLSGATS